MQSLNELVTIYIKALDDVKVKLNNYCIVISKLESKDDIDVMYHKLRFELGKMKVKSIVLKNYKITVNKKNIKIKEL